MKVGDIFTYTRTGRMFKIISIVPGTILAKMILPDLTPIGAVGMNYKFFDASIPFMDFTTTKILRVLGEI